LIGIDIGTKNIKVALLEPKGDEFVVSSALMCSAPTFEQGVRQDALLASKIKSLLKETYSFSKNAAASIGGSQIVVRNFELAALSAEEMEGAVMLEAKQFVTADIASMACDFQELSSQGNDKKDILFIGAPAQQVDNQVQVIESTGLNIELLDIDSLAAVNCYLALDKNASNQSVVLLNIGHTYTNIAVIDSGTLRFVRNVTFGGANITAEIAGVYKVPVETAEEIKKSTELRKTLGLNIKNVLRKSMPDLLEAVYRSMEYCMNRKKILNIDKILITGGASSLSGMEAFISDSLGIAAEKWNPLEHIETDDASRIQLGSCFTVALGLAVRPWKNS